MKPTGGTPLPDPRHMRAWARRKAAARAYQPKRVRLLIVDESPPSEDAAYFYFEEGDAADVVFREVCTVLFESAPGASKTPYLKELRRRGVFVVELKPDAPRGDETLGPYVAPLLLNLDALAPRRSSSSAPTSMRRHSRR